jgi:hypothetical protein
VSTSSLSGGLSLAAEGHSQPYATPPLPAVMLGSGLGADEPQEVRDIRLTRDFSESDKIPYFLWDRSITVAELRDVLANPAAPDRDALLALLLREARPDEVWAFVSPHVVAAEWPRLAPRLGARRAFWGWLLEEWRKLGLLAR